MTKAEMILKVVMSPTEPAKTFTEQYLKLLPECQLSEFYKVLEMKGLKKNEQSTFVELFRAQKPANQDDNYDALVSPEHEAGRIKKLEKLIKKRLPN